ncbi:MAG: hypothetical protein WC812_01890 [Candidatus Pacearchaeota archaeon]|jgi:hypothetical protein
MIYIPVIEIEANTQKQTYHLIEINNSKENSYIKIIKTGHNENHLIQRIKDKGLTRLLLNEENEIRRTYDRDLIKKSLKINESSKLKFTDILYYSHFKSKIKK